MTVLNNELRKNRKTERFCHECYRGIKVGEVYRYQFAAGYPTYDPGAWQCCEQCDVLLHVVWALPDVYRQYSDEGFLFSDVGRDLIEETDSLPLRRAYAWWLRRWVKADGTPLPIQEVRDMLNYHSLDL